MRHGSVDNNLTRAVQADPLPMAGRQDFDGAKQCPGRLCRAIGQQARQTALIQRIAQLPCRQQRSHLAGEKQAATGVAYIEWFDAQRVACQQQVAGYPIEPGERIHALQPAETIGSPLTQAMQQHLGIAMAAKTHPCRAKFAGQGGSIVDFAVEDQKVAGLGMRHRLMTGGRRVLDSETPVTETDTRRASGSPGQTLVIRPAMLLRPGHTCQRGLKPGSVRPDNTGYAAHVRLSSRRSR